MSKIVEGAKEALEAAQCDHAEMIPQPPLTLNSKMDRFYCPKCKAHLYSPRPSWRT
jgi:RNase P subunit RPR2